jgi:hypothetical protein
VKTYIHDFGSGKLENYSMSISIGSGGNGKEIFIVRRKSNLTLSLRFHDFIKEVETATKIAVAFFYQ